MDAKKFIQRVDEICKEHLGGGCDECPLQKATQGTFLCHISHMDFEELLKEAEK